MMKIIRNCYDNKLCDILDNKQVDGNRICILFNHGLGDFINFLPLFDSIVKKYPNYDFNIGFTPDRNYVYLHPKGVLIDAPYGKYNSIFDLMIGIQYPNPPRGNELINYYKQFGIKDADNITKVELCNEMEIGLPNFIWEPYKFKINSKIVKERIGVHFFGHALAKLKNIDIEISSIIWNEIIESGFIPFEIQMIPTDYLSVIEVPNFINKDNSLRYNFPNIGIMSESIAKCKYFLGIDSGPLYLAGAILGFDKCIGLEKKIEFKKIIPYKIKSINVLNYKKGNITNALIEGIK